MVMSSVALVRERVLAGPNSNCVSKLFTEPHVREGDPQQENSKCSTVIKIWPWVPDGYPNPK
jgi:hypothetical protein